MFLWKHLKHLAYVADRVEMYCAMRIRTAVSAKKNRALK
jgi:hypothetical protein